MNPSKEHRLIYRTQAQINAQRKKAGVKEVSTAKPTRVVTPTGTITATQANAQMQEANRVTNNKTSSYQTYIDPNTGRDIRYNYNEHGVRNYDMSNPNAEMLTQQTTGPIGTTQKKSPVTTSPFAASPSRRDPRNPSGFVASGAKVGDERDFTPKIPTADTSSLEQKVDERRNERLKENGGMDSTAAGDISDVDSDITDTPNAENTGMELAIANLPPEAQFLAPYLQQFQQSIQQSMQENAGLTQGLLSGLNESSTAIDKQLEDIRQGYLASTDAMQDLIEDAKEQSEISLAQQKKSEEERINWMELDQRRQLSKEKRDTHEALVANFALMGAGFQPAAIAVVMEADAEFDSKMRDLAVEMTFARTDLAAKFSGLYVANQENYVNATIGNMKELRTSLEKIAMQSISNKVSTQEAEQKILVNAWNTQAGLRQTMANKTLEIGQMITQSILDNRLAQQKEAKWQYEQQWDEYKFNAQQQRLEEQFSLSMEDRQIAREDRLDTQEFAKANQKVQQIRSSIEGNKVMTPYRKDIQPLYQNMKTAYEAGDNAFSDRALAKIYEKMIEPNSVVMPGEYLDIASSAPLLNKLAGKFNKVLNGGQAWTDTERKELFDLSTKFHATYKKRFDEAAQQYYTDIDWFNSTVGPSNQIIYEQVGLPTYSSQRSRLLLEDRAPAGLFPDGEGGGEDSSVVSPFLSMGKITQQFNTPIASRENGGLYDESTVKAWSGTHQGIDIAIPQGTKLPSPASGTVVYAGYDGGWGGTVVIRDTNGAEWRLSHLSEIPPNIKIGSSVTRGSFLAKSGGSKGTKGAGNSTGGHLDLRIKVNGKYIDPLKYRSLS